MKIKLYKLKKGKKGKWFGWCSLLMTNFKKEAIETLKEEGLNFEGSGSFKLNGQIYVLGMFGAYLNTLMPTNLKKQLNKDHKAIIKEYLEYMGEVEMNYKLYNK